MMRLVIPRCIPSESADALEILRGAAHEVLAGERHRPSERDVEKLLRHLLTPKLLPGWKEPRGVWGYASAPSLPPPHKTPTLVAYRWRARDGMHILLEVEGEVHPQPIYDHVYTCVPVVIDEWRVWERVFPERARRARYLRVVHRLRLRGLPPPPEHWQVADIVEDPYSSMAFASVREPRTYRLYLITPVGWVGLPEGTPIAYGAQDVLERLGAPADLSSPDWEQEMRDWLIFHIIAGGIAHVA